MDGGERKEKEAWIDSSNDTSHSVFRPLSNLVLKTRRLPIHVEVGVFSNSAFQSIPSTHFQSRHHILRHERVEGRSFGEDQTRPDLLFFVLSWRNCQPMAASGSSRGSV